jgi:hypothetical protein
MFEDIQCDRGGVMAAPVRVRRLAGQEGQQPQRIVRRGSTSSVRYRRAMMILASTGGNRVPVIAELVQADEDTVREVIHRFNEIGLACLDPQWAGGRPRLFSPDDEDFVIQTAATRPAKLGQPFTRWPVRKLAACRLTDPRAGPSSVASPFGRPVAEVPSSNGIYVPLDETLTSVQSGTYHAQPSAATQRDRSHRWIGRAWPTRRRAADRLGIDSRGCPRVGWRRPQPTVRGMTNWELEC